MTTAARIRHALGFDLEERRQMPTWTDALRRFIEQADALGVLVMVSGVVGSNNRRKLDPQEFRGFALADDLAPLVFINGADTKAAQMFTLAHELAHIWLGQSALSDAQASLGARTRGRALVQPGRRRAAGAARGSARRVRPERRLARRGRPPGAALQGQHAGHPAPHPRRRRAHAPEQFWQAYDAELERLRAIPKGSGGDFYLTLGARASKRFARALVVSTLEGQTSFTRGVPPARLQEDGDIPRSRAQPGGGFLMAYLLDADVFIRAKNLHYGLDFCPAFWDWLIASNAAGTVFSIEKVGDEVAGRGGRIVGVGRSARRRVLPRPDASDVPALAAVSTWATGQRYEPAAVSTFLQVADYYLVAQAHAAQAHGRHARDCPRPRRARSRFPTPASASASSA